MASKQVDIVVDINININTNSLPSLFYSHLSPLYLFWALSSRSWSLLVLVLGRYRLPHYCKHCIPNSIRIHESM